MFAPTNNGNSLPSSPLRSKRESTQEQQEAIDEINAFEKALKSFDNEEIANKLDDILVGTTKEYIDKIRVIPLKFDVILKFFQERKQIEVIARTERDKRRRKALVEQLQVRKMWIMFVYLPDKNRPKSKWKTEDGKS